MRKRGVERGSVLQCICVSVFVRRLGLKDKKDKKSQMLAKRNVAIPLKSGFIITFESFSRDIGQLPPPGQFPL